MSAPPHKPRAPHAAPDTLETERMIGERVNPQHADEIIELMLDPRVGNTLWPTPDPPPKVKVIVQLEANIEQWERRGFGIWLLRDRTTGEMVGAGWARGHAGHRRRGSRRRLGDRAGALEPGPRHRARPRGCRRRV